MITVTASGAGRRLLPWGTPDGRPCYLLGGGSGRVSRLADDIERTQLGMALELLEHAGDMLDDRHVTPDQLRYLAARMAEALYDVHRIAVSRGDRLSAEEP